MRTLLAWLVGSLGMATAAAEPPRPNVVLFLADDLSPVDIAPYGGRDVPTPNLSRLASAGVRFTQAFVASPSCAPSRAALLTGLDPMRNGAMLNHSRPKAELKKWPAYFRDLGYDVVAIGKVAHYAQVTEYGFDHVSHFKPQEHVCISESVKWLANRTSTKPLCLLVGTNWPHVPWPQETTFVEQTLPPKFVDTPETRMARSRYLTAVSNCDRDLGLVYDAANKHLGENVIFAFTSDHGSQFPFGKWNCYDSGVHTPLLIAWPKQIKPGTSTAAMVSWIDLLPTFLHLCGGAPPETLSGRSFKDVLLKEVRTHRDKVYFTHSADGKMNRYPIRAVRTSEWKYIWNLDPTAEHHTHIDNGLAGTDGRSYWDTWAAKAASDPHAANIVKRYHTRPAEELYDLANDPSELKNLAAEPVHAARLKTLRADLEAWMQANGDNGLATERTLQIANPKK